MASLIKTCNQCAGLLCLCRDLNDAKMRTCAMELIAAQAILAFHKPTTASPFTAQLVSEGGISTILKLVNFIILTPQLVDLRCVMNHRAHLIQLMEPTKCDPDADCSSSPSGQWRGADAALHCSI